MFVSTGCRRNGRRSHLADAGDAQFAGVSAQFLTDDGCNDGDDLAVILFGGSGSGRSGSGRFLLAGSSAQDLGEDGDENKDTLEYKIAFLKAILDEDYPKNGGIIELSDTSSVTSRVS